MKEPARVVSRIEWPTIALAALIYGAWAVVTCCHALIPLPLRVMIGAWLIAWHGSLQHEIIHGHPTPWRRFNTILALPPLAIWLPFEIYRRCHITHHVLEHLTDPARDPESRYLAPGPGRTARLARSVGRLQQSLLGRLTLGPMVDAWDLLAREGVRLARGDRDRLRIWALHAIMVAAILAWLRFVCHFSLGQYLLCFVYPGLALSLVRSFAEHRAHPDPARRTAIVERAPVLGLLFLYNNLHVAHHFQPDLPWYALPALYRRERERLLAANGGLVYDGYADVFRRYLLRPHDELMHAAALAARR
jgi:fatty acid desaturase